MVFQWKWSKSPYIPGKAGSSLWLTWWQHAPWVGIVIKSKSINRSTFQSRHLLKDEGQPDGIHMVWETPDTLYPTFNIVNVAVGLDGDLLDLPTAEEQGYVVQKLDSKFQISVPFDADGRHRKVGS